MKSTRIVLVAALAAASTLTAAAPAPSRAAAEAASCRIDITYVRQAQIDSRVTVNAEDDVVAEVTCLDTDLTSYWMSARFYQLVDGVQRGSWSYQSRSAVAGAATAVFTAHEVFQANDPTLSKASKYCVQLFSPQSLTVCADPVVVGLPEGVAGNA
jgi:hypothetical protein